ncbi:LLM class flavin-dependent oxidoreductase [Gordonia amicalis]|uniref:LLM class flavin-dependent oxidoreductase n=1 Tax=Gordonia amicalis TaxID=89053 RepID=A0ABU4DAK4_9ACTN|nr:LLM class flavin-dependent oxidoreductase [Gordonia amicalis]MDV6306732.1 LLM class flavin-dependent oxidoreductase [Gordonia amicalis]MDV7099052.1 LLM class flavin-dependent oxidoreductase [Gordonia amicalis]
MSTSDVSFGLWYDFRNPPGNSRGFGDFYRATLDQIVWAESIGIDSVWLTEHHFMEDGYTPSPFLLASAIGDRTTTMRIGTNLVVSPLHNPIRLAEDSATLSLLTGGRFSLGVGQGYWEPEFEAFGRRLINRPSLLEEGVEIVASLLVRVGRTIRRQAPAQTRAARHAHAGDDPRPPGRRDGRSGDRTSRTHR